MHIIGVQYDKQTGPDAVRQYKLTLTIDETHKLPFLKWLAEADKGSSWLMMLFSIDKENGDIEEMSNENPEQTKKRFQRRMHALINEKAKEHDKEPEEIKKIVKDLLTKKGYMVESSKELSIEGYASAISYLTNEF